MSAIRNPSTLLCAMALSSLACSNTSTGNPIIDVPGETANHGDPCEERGAVSLELDEQSALGVSAAELLAFADSAKTQTLVWQPPSRVSVGPESGEQTLTIELKSRGQARFVDYERKASGPEIGGECPDRLEVPVTLKLRTQGGALDESIDTVLSARSPRVARIYHQLKAADIAGSLVVESQDDLTFSTLSVALSLTEFGSSGSLTPSLEKIGDGVATQAALRPVASWGAGGCENESVSVPSDAPVAQFSATDALLLLEATPTSQASIQGEQVETSFSFSPTGNGVCAVLEASNYAPPGADGEIGTLRIQGTLTVSAADKFEAELSGTLTARPNPDGTLDGLFFDGVRENVVGFSDVDVSAYDKHLLSAQLQLTSNGDWGGNITLMAYDLPDCESADGPNGSSGCAGAEFQELASLEPNP